VADFQHIKVVTQVLYISSAIKEQDVLENGNLNTTDLFEKEYREGVYKQ
jgi:hypothetical protein